MIAAKHVIRYLKGTTDLGLYYGRDHDYRLYGYTDSAWVGSVAHKKNTSDGCYGLGSALISWFSPVFLSVQLKQSTLQLAPLFGKPYGFGKMMSGIFDMEVDTTVILCDIQSCIKMTNNPVGYGTEGIYKTPVCEYQ